MLQPLHGTEDHWTCASSAPDRPWTIEVASSGSNRAQLIDLHDLGNMLQVAASALALLERRFLADASGADRILSGGREALQCAGELARRLLGSALPIDPESRLIDVAEALERVAWQASALAPQGIRVEMFAGDGLESLAFDRLALINALLNLVMNAVQSPHQWLLDRRVEQARTLLMTTDRSLSDIATTCGFADQSHFSRAFAKRAGWSPGAWRRAHAECASI